MVAEQGSGLLRATLRWAGTLLIAASAIYFLAAIAEHADVLYRFDWTPHRLLLVSGLIVGQLALIGLTTILWLTLLRVIGDVTPVRVIFIVRLLAQFAKYLPGNVAQHFGRLGLAKMYHMDLRKVGVTMGLEFILLFFAIATIAYVSLLFGDWRAVAIISSRELSLALGIAAITLGVGIVLLRQRSEPIDRWIRRPPEKWMLVMGQGFIGYLVTVSLMGAMLSTPV